MRKIFTFLLALVASVGMSWATTTDLASITGNYTAQDGEILTGTLGVNVKISIADGATVTLLNANINGDKTWTTGEYAGLTCLGDATITIVGKNSVSGFSVGNGYPGIYVPSGKTLIINGTGSLTAQSSTQEAAGIGAGKTTHCGNIEIQSGKITAIAGGEEGAGIGGAFNANCGDITISGGIVTAVGGDYSAGIGGGKRSAKTDAGHCGKILISGGVVSATSGKQAAAIGGGRGNNVNFLSNCGDITITNTALKVYAEQGGEKGSTNTIGAGKYNNCGTVTIGGNTGVINADPYTYQTKEDKEIVVDYINAIGTVVYTQECKDKIDIARELYDALEDAQKDLVSNYQTLLDAEAEYATLIPVKLYHNFYGDWMETEAFGIFDDYTSKYAKISMILEPGDYQFALKLGGELRGDGTAFSREKQARILAEGFTANMTLNVDVKGTYRFYWFFKENKFAMDVPNVCGMYWQDVTDDKFEVTLGKESEVTLPKVYTTNMGFATNIFNGVDQVRLVSTDETVATIAYTISEKGLGTITIHKAGECDIYAVHDITDYYCYDSVAFHLTVNPESTPTVWTSLSVGDVIKVGDQLNPSEEWESANDYGVIKPAWAPYTLLRANIVQEHEWDDPVVTEAEEGAYYVFKFTHPTSGTSYLLANSAKSPLLAATASSDGLEVTNVGDDYGTPAFTFAVHDNGGPTAIENTNLKSEIKNHKLIKDGMLLIEHNGKTYTVTGQQVR